MSGEQFCVSKEQFCVSGESTEQFCVSRFLCFQGRVLCVLDTIVFVEGNILVCPGSNSVWQCNNSVSPGSNLVCRRISSVCPGAVLIVWGAIF